jgi:hypothetical protein
MTLICGGLTAKAEDVPLSQEIALVVMNQQVASAVECHPYSTERSR